MNDVTKTEELRTRQLLETLSWCSSRSDWYRSALAPLVDSIRSVDDLIRLPTINKSIVAEHHARLITDMEFPAHVGISSGTTSTPQAPILTRVYRSSDEIQAFRSVLSVVDSGSGTLPLGLQIINALHGDSFVAEERGRFRMPLEMPFHYAHIRDLLTQNHKFRGFGERISYLVGNVSSLQLLTGLILQRDRGLLETIKIETMYAHSSLLTDRWRSNLSSLFDATVVSIYGISEIAGAGAVECAACGHFHMPPFIIPEIVDVFADDKRVEIGELTLTSLVPFTRVQPLIRFRTGDLVELTGKCDAVPDLGFKFRGRRRNSIYDGELGLVLAGADVLHVVDGFHDVAIEEYPMARRLGLDPSGYGLPRLSVSARRSAVLEITMMVELCYEPALHAGAAQKFVDDFRVALSSRCKELDKHIATGAAKLTIIPVRPNALGEGACFKG
jgi:hypothetical protein